MTLENFLVLIDPYKAHAATLLALTVLDFVTGVLLALKTKSFDFRKLADTYRTSVLPQIGGFLIFSVATPYLSAELLGEAGALLGAVSVNGLWLAAVATQVASVVRNVRAISAPAE